MRLAARLALVCLISGFAIFVWPTRYRYDRIQMLGETAPGPMFPVRIDRFSGEAEILLPAMLGDSRHRMDLAWVGTTGELLPESAVAELRTGTAIDTEPLPYVQILNTTEWQITKTRWTVTSAAAAGVNGGTTTRTVDHSVHIEPNSLAAFYLELGRFGHDASIALDKAWGVRRSE